MTGSAAADEMKAVSAGPLATTPAGGHGEERRFQEAATPGLIRLDNAGVSAGGDASTRIGDDGQEPRLAAAAPAGPDLADRKSVV